MQGSESSVHNQPARLAANTTRGIRPLFTARRLSYVLAGAFVFVGAALAADRGNSSASSTNGSDAQHFTTQSASETSGESSQSSSEAPSHGTTTNFSSTSSSNGTTSITNMQLQVNGQDIPVPQNGSTQQTVTSSDGAQTTVNASSSGGSSSNSSSYSVHVETKSSPKGGSIMH